MVPQPTKVDVANQDNYTSSKTEELRKLLTPSFHQEDFPELHFWIQKVLKQWKKKNPQSQGEDQALFPFLEDTAGKPLEVGTDANILFKMCGIWRGFKTCGIAPPTWGVVSDEVRKEFYAEVIADFPEVGLCANNWKVELMAMQ